LNWKRYGKLPKMAIYTTNNIKSTTDMFKKIIGKNYNQVSPLTQQNICGYTV